MSKFDINQHETVYALSNALDLVGLDRIHHGKRVAYIAAEFCRAGIDGPWTCSRPNA